MQPVEKDDDGHQREGHFQNYADYSRTLRAWLVAYGIGGPVLFVTNKDISERIANSGQAEAIVAAFLIGVGLQILLALINKWAAWQMYAGAGHPEYQKTLMYKSWDFINSQSWIDFWMDVLSIVAFAWATVSVLRVFATPVAGAVA